MARTASGEFSRSVCSSIGSQLVRTHSGDSPAWCTSTHAAELEAGPPPGSIAEGETFHEEDRLSPPRTAGGVRRLSSASETSQASSVSEGVVENVKILLQVPSSARPLVAPPAAVIERVFLASGPGHPVRPQRAGRARVSRCAPALPRARWRALVAPAARSRRLGRRCARAQRLTGAPRAGWQVRLHVSCVRHLGARDDDLRPDPLRCARACKANPEAIA